MATLLPTPFACLYRPIPCPLGDHLHAVGELDTVYEALPCAQCRHLNITAAAAFRLRPRLGQHERVVLTALATPPAPRLLPAVPVSHLVMPEPRPAQSALTQSVHLLATRALAVVRRLPMTVSRRTGTLAVKDTVWVEATAFGGLIAALPPGRHLAARSVALETRGTEGMTQTLTTSETVVHDYLERLQRLLTFLIPTLQGLHPRIQHRPRGQSRLQQCALAFEHLHRVAPQRAAAVLEQCDAPLANGPLTAQCRPTTGDEYPDGDEYCGRGSRDREN